MSCELSKGVLHGYLDNELDAARAAEFERHLESCRECAAMSGSPGTNLTTRSVNR